MNPTPLERLLVCYVPALDLRRISPATCPHLSELFSACGWARVHTLPTTEHVPTMLTGALPHEHGCWGPRLKPEQRRSRTQRLVDGLPDLLPTTVQGLRHMLAGPYDLATMPPRRRRRFEWTRFKYVKHDEVHKVVLPINGMESVFTVLGAGNGLYFYHDDYRHLDRLLDQVANEAFELEMVEVHCLDRLQHWRLPEEREIEAYYRGVDDFLAALQAKCQRGGTSLLILSDHGMEPVSGWLDVQGELAQLDLPEEGYDFFIENTRATFWLHSEAVRAKIEQHLASLDHAVPLTRQAMDRYGLHFADRSFGDLFLYATPGYSFFPNDFHQPLATAMLSLMDWQQRPRLRDPRHKGDHGYLPENECENGFVLLADERYAVREEPVTLLDVAPSILWLLGQPAPATMRGRSAFRSRSTV